jgi:hypothetical protein
MVTGQLTTGVNHHVKWLVVLKIQRKYAEFRVHYHLIPRISDHRGQWDGHAVNIINYSPLSQRRL